MKTGKTLLGVRRRFLAMLLAAVGTSFLMAAPSRTQEPEQEKNGGKGTAQKAAPAAGKAVDEAAQAPAAPKIEGSSGSPAEGSSTVPPATDGTEAGASKAGAPAREGGVNGAAKGDGFLPEPLGREGCPLCPVTNKEEIVVLMRLRERHSVLVARENVVAQKEAALAKLEDTLDAQLTKYDVAIAKLEQRLNIGAAQQVKREAQLKALVDTLQGLSAKKAAPMLAEASPDFVAEIFRQLGPQRVASLLSVMPPSKAGKLIDLAVEAKTITAAELRAKGIKPPRAALPPPAAGDNVPPPQGDEK